MFSLLVTDHQHLPAVISSWESHLIHGRSPLFFDTRLFPANPEQRLLLLLVNSLSFNREQLLQVKNLQELPWHSVISSVFSFAQKSLHWGVLTIEFPQPEQPKQHFSFAESAGGFTAALIYSWQRVKIKGREVKTQRLVPRCGRWLSTATSVSSPLGPFCRALPLVTQSASQITVN